MPKVNVYLPDDLAEAVRDAGIPVSPLCQHVLHLAVRRLAAIRDASRSDLDPATDPAAGLTQFTERACNAVRSAVDTARAGGAPAVDTGHLLGGLLAEGNNLALLILRSLEIEPAKIVGDLAAATAGPDRTEPHADSWRFSDPAGEALRLAVTESFALGHNYVGCEHLLLGLVTEPHGVAGGVLRALGADQRMSRRAVAAALHGFVHARSQATAPATAVPDASALAAAVAAQLNPIAERLDRLERRLAEVSGD
ncbi:MAG TPA: Clp protease N-terminal domain-containing protein [Mycobacteriales bacterium]|nr:Clp protease N-terminal domain-containing protein [Mycobacteriales bacterium]